MGDAPHPEESKNTIDARRIRRELDKRNATLTREEMWQKEREAMDRARAMGAWIEIADPRHRTAASLA